MARWPNLAQSGIGSPGLKNGETNDPTKMSMATSWVPLAINLMRSTLTTGSVFLPINTSNSRGMILGPSS